jgi:hypothetical protein
MRHFGSLHAECEQDKEMARHPKHFVESHHKYLLYIDILGFSEMVQKHPEVIPSLYHIIATANAQKHGDFEVVLFSDTILVYNRYAPCSANDRMFTVMFLCEFCQDLFYRLSAIDVFFRAVIVDGDFQHYNLGRATCFFGTSLIDAYLREKEIKSVGAFIHSRCLEHCHVFTTVPHTDDLHFLILTKPIENLGQTSGGVFPIHPIVFQTVDQLSLWSDLRAMKKIHARMNDQVLPPAVTQKFLKAWEYYKKALGTTLEFFEKNSFDLHAILPDFDWQDADWDDSPYGFPYPLTPQQFGFLMAFSCTAWDYSFEKVVALAVLEALQEADFNGRCEYYHSRAAFGNLQVYYVALGLKDTKGKQFGDYDWWTQFQATVLQRLAHKGTPFSETKLSEQASMGGIRKDHNFCGAIMMRQGTPTIVIEHPDRLGTSAFTEVVKSELLKNIPGDPRA